MTSYGPWARSLRCLSISSFVSDSHRVRPFTLSTQSLARAIHESRREAFETEIHQGFSQVRPTEAYVPSVEEAEREQPRRARGSDNGVRMHE